MFGGGGGLDPRKMKQMMKQMGIEVTEIDANEIVVRTDDEELVFTDVEVQRMDAQGQATYQIVGEPETRALGSSGGSKAEGEVDTGSGADEVDVGAADEIPDSDVQIVAQRTGASEEAAREALEAESGDLAAAVARLE
ncbi:nascent polypeptide-associated complex protein [Halomarina oriensis]|uniref:Nascent polypeptide-associated complex protein n=1 Tax=Halomarina oriensis TaxID=671145 RepID=A0A6B0GNP4_9EURY|nr:nascent polypeptide-associated complex protein [Halomarina oriensis]MWG35207.1 nascent polypeptide-associated complex protein [Halomarina oriensis]